MFTTWGDSLSESDQSEQGENVPIIVMEDEVQVFDLLFVLMAETDDNEDEPVTLLDIKENLKNCSLNKLRSLASVLSDSMNELFKDKENLKKVLKKYDEKVIKLSV